jgi:hypothetical protein
MELKSYLEVYTVPSTVDGWKTYEVRVRTLEESGENNETHETDMETSRTPIKLSDT